jgi:hypothetical protein
MTRVVRCFSAFTGIEIRLGSEIDDASFDPNARHDSSSCEYFREPSRRQMENIDTQFRQQILAESGLRGDKQKQGNSGWSR